MKQFVAVRRSTVAVLFASLVFTAVAEVTVSTENFIVRQQWPWSGKIVAEFQVTGEVTAPGATAQVKAYDGDTFICDVPVSEISGDVVITTTGTKRLSFDPTKIAALKARGLISNFRLGVSYADGSVDYTAPSVLYVIFDLEKKADDAGFVQVLTETDITAGSSAKEGTGPYGAWKRQYWDAGADTVAWLGVNADVYKTTKLVMRHVPAQTFMMGSPDDEPGRLPNEDYNDYANQIKNCGLEDRRQVTMTDYYIGVFELTQKQWKLLDAPRAGSFANSAGDACPANFITYLEVRGAQRPTDTMTDGFMLRLGNLVGSAWKVDLPSEAQWEAACRAGTDTGLYDGTQLPTDISYYTLQGRSKMKEIKYEPLAKLAVFFNGNNDQNTVKVGQKLPNNYGLYDMLGNAGELCLDRVEPNTGFGTEPATDPVSLYSGNKRPMRGGASDIWASYQFGIGAYRCAARAAVDYSSSARQIGFRVAMKPVVQAPAE